VVVNYAYQSIHEACADVLSVAHTVVVVAAQGSTLDCARHAQVQFDQQPSVSYTQARNL
jgi:hypothetical protein